MAFTKPRISELDSSRLSRLLEVGHGLAADLDLDAVLQRVLDAARELTGARYAAVGVLDAGRRGLERFVTQGIDEAGQRQIGHQPRGRGVLGVLIEEPRPLRLSDLSAHPRSYGFPLGHPPMSSFLGVPIVIADRAWGNLYLTDKQGGDFTAQDEQVILMLARWTATALANARKYRVEQQRREELERVNRALDTTSSITLALGGETELERILELIVQRGRALVDARMLVISLVEQDEIVVAAAAGEVDPHFVGSRYPLTASSASHYVLKSQHARRLSDLPADVEERMHEQLQAEAALLTPLVFRGRSVGVLAAFDRLHGERDFTIGDAPLLEAFAASAATAVWMAQDVAAQGLRRSIEASERERTRWARELHDDPLQQLAMINVGVAAAARSEDLEVIRRRLSGVTEQIEDGIASLRVLIADLRPAALDELGVQPAVEALVERVGADTGLAIELSVHLVHPQDGRSTRLTPAIEDTIYRSTQEALNNVVKHAHAQHARVAIDERADAIEIDITDDGVGFDPAASASGFGLVGMRERIALARGTLDIRSVPGSGSTVHLALPAEHADAGRRWRPTRSQADTRRC